MVYTTSGLANLYTATQSVTLNDHGPKSHLRKKVSFSGCVLNAKATKHVSITIQH